MDITHWIAVLRDWQDLAGSFLGAFIAIIVSVLGFIIVRRIKMIDERKDILRRVEISTAYSLQTTLIIQNKLMFMAGRVRSFVAEIRALTQPNELVFSRMNYIPLGKLYLDPEGHNSRMKSYYLHNKLLITHSQITNINLQLEHFKEDFELIIQMNERMIDITDKQDPEELRKTYALNLEGFAQTMEEYSKSLDETLNALLQIRVYNLGLRKKFGRGSLWRWRNEGMAFTIKTLEIVDAIDLKIAPAVAAQKKQANLRQQRLQQEQPMNTLA